MTAANNPTLWKHVTEFYDEAGTGVKLVIYPVTGTQKMTDLCDYTKNVAGTLRDLITRRRRAARHRHSRREHRQHRQEPERT